MKNDKRAPADTVIRASAVQISPVLYSRQGTVEKVVNKIRELGKKGVQFATFPETCIPYYPYFSFVQPAFAMGRQHQLLLEESVTVPSSATEAIGEAAQKAQMVVSIGINERVGGTIYNTQLLFDSDGTLVQRRRKISPTYSERMVWGQGDGSGLHVTDSAVGRIGQLACWEHYNPLARYSLIAEGEQIHSAMYPGSIFGPLFTEQTEVNIRQHALESGCFVVCASAWLHPDQQALIMKDTGCPLRPISGGCLTAIIDPSGQIIGEPLKEGEGEVIADLDFTLIDNRKRLMDAVGHYSRPDLLRLCINRAPSHHVHDWDPSYKDAMGSDFRNHASHTPKSKAANWGTRSLEIKVGRFGVVSSRPFEEVVQEFTAALGHPDMMVFHSAMTLATTVAELEVVVGAAVGSSGLMEFNRFDAGEILRKETGGSGPHILRILIGNPIIMKEMAKLVPDAASYAPITILIDERTDGVYLSYDTMASLLAPYGNQQAVLVAAELDRKVGILLEKAAYGESRDEEVTTILEYS